MDKLSILIPDRTFSTSGGEVKLSPFKFKQFKEALAIVEKYLSLLTKFETTNELLSALFQKAQEDYIVLDDIMALSQLVTAKPKEFFDDLNYDEVLGILTEIIEMNIDFFSRMSNKLQKRQEEAAAESPKTGEPG